MAKNIFPIAKYKIKNPIPAFSQSANRNSSPTSKHFYPITPLLRQS